MRLSRSLRPPAPSLRRSPYRTGGVAAVSAAACPAVLSSVRTCRRSGRGDTSVRHGAVGQCGRKGRRRRRRHGWHDGVGAVYQPLDAQGASLPACWSCKADPVILGAFPRRRAFVLDERRVASEFFRWAQLIVQSNDDEWRAAEKKLGVRVGEVLLRPLALQYPPKLRGYIQQSTPSTLIRYVKARTKAGRAALRCGEDSPMGLGRTQIATDVEDLKAQVKQLAKRPAAGMQ